MKTIPLVLVTLQVALTLVYSTAVRAEDSDADSCNASLASARRFLQGKTTVHTHVLELSQQYQDHPSVRSLGYTIVLNDEERSSPHRIGPPSPAWNKAAGVMKSPQLQKSVATQIIQACSTIGAVTFVLDVPRSSPWEVVFGIMPDGAIAEFQCVENPRRQSNGLDWGFIYCI
jgi:hypothetical protein